MDMALLHTGLGSTEICEACSTINIASARFCKGCTHKLATFYDDERAFEPTFLTARQQPGSLVLARTLDLVAFWLVLNLLAGITALVPIA
ncbi:hypothetical protein APY03_7095 [Variovorax sp. WDL1]|nr:hypothetical protein APY03_7095 [Variovorax sp. WDL1]